MLSTYSKENLIFEMNRSISIKIWKKTMSFKEVERTSRMLHLTDGSECDVSILTYI